MAKPTQPGARPLPAPAPPTGRVRLRTLVFIRWFAVAGQATTLLVVQFGLGFDLPLNETLAAVAASALLNLTLTLYRPAARLGDRAATVLLAWDLLQLSVLLYFTGGLENPFAFLLAGPLVVSATILSRASTVALAALGLAAASVLALWHEKLPWTEPGIDLPLLYVGGVWIAIVTSALFIGAYVASVNEEAIRMSDALSATQMALAREQRLSALGALAAAAAHELSTPLGTIAVVAKEIAHDSPKEGPLADDLRLLQSEAARCRDILARLAARPEDAGPVMPLPLSALVDVAMRPHRREGIALRIHLEGAEPEPTLVAADEIVYGLGNLLQNAMQFARRAADVTIGWNAQTLTLTIDDDGPGFPSAVLDRIGDPYLSTRKAEGNHMGLGIFIAVTLLERSGAGVHFRNRPTGGATVDVTWPRALFGVGEGNLP